MAMIFISMPYYFWSFEAQRSIKVICVPWKYTMSLVPILTTQNGAQNKSISGTTLIYQPELFVWWQRIRAV